MNNYALYYPRLEFHDYEWLWAASLVWDRVYRILPSGYRPDDPPNVVALCAGGEIGAPLDPSSAAADVAVEFVKKLQDGEWSAAALTLEVPEEYARLHKGKVDVALREMMIAKGSATSQDEWLHVPTNFEALYMTFLATRIADRNSLQLVSDLPAAWTGATYFAYDGCIEPYPLDEHPSHLATLVIRDFVPDGLAGIEPDRLLKFREGYREERQAFVDSFRSFAAAIARCDDQKVIRDIVSDCEKDLKRKLEEYKQTMRVLNLTGWGGMKSLSFPAATTILTSIAEAALDPTTLAVPSGAGVALGVISGLSDLQVKKRDLSRASICSYLVHLGREFDGWPRTGGSYNYFLCREMEEFIND